MLARSLSLEDFGAVNTGIAVVGFSLMGTTLGLPDVGSRDVAVAPSDAREIAGRVLTGRLCALAIFAPLVGLPVVALGLASPVLVVTTLVMTLCLAVSADWLLRGFDRMPAVATSASLGGLTVLAGSVILVPRFPSPAAALGVFTAGELVASAWTWRSTGVDRLPPIDLRGTRTMLRRSWPVGISAFLVYSYYANLDTILLAATRSTQEAGLYSAPYRLFLAVNVVGTFAAYAVFPQIARNVAAQKDSDAIRLLRATLPVLCAYGLVVLGVAELVGAQLLGELFGRRFHSMATVLVLLCLAVPWYTVGFPVGYALIARERNRRFLLGAGLAGGVNLLLDAVLIPSFGPIGAATATVVALMLGSVAWLGAHGFIDRRLLPIGALLLLASAMAVTAVVFPITAQIVGASTVVLAVLSMLVHVLRTSRHLSTE